MYVTDCKIKGYRGISLDKFLFKDEMQEKFANNILDDVYMYTSVSEEILSNPLSEQTSFVQLFKKVKSMYLDKKMTAHQVSKNKSFFAEKLYNYNERHANENPLCVSTEFYDDDMKKDISNSNELNCAVRTLDFANRMAAIMDYKSKEAIQSMVKNKNAIDNYFSVYEALNEVNEFAQEEQVNMQDGSKKSALDCYLELMSVYTDGDANIVLDGLELEEIEAEDKRKFDGYCKVRRKFLELYKDIKYIIPDEMQGGNELETKNKVMNTALFKYLAAEQAKESFYEIKSFALRKCIKEYSKQKENTEPKIVISSGIDPKKVKSDYFESNMDKNLDAYKRGVKIDCKGFSKPVVVHCDEPNYEKYLEIYGLTKHQIPDADFKVGNELQPILLFKITEEQNDYISKFLRDTRFERRVSNPSVLGRVNSSKDILNGILNVGNSKEVITITR